MGRNSKSKRDARQKRAGAPHGGGSGAGGPFGARHFSSHGPSSGHDHPYGAVPAPQTPLDVVIDAVRAAAEARAGGHPTSARECASALCRQPYVTSTRVVDSAVAQVLQSVLRLVWVAGWLPEDLFQVARRTQSDLAAALVVDVIATDSATYAREAIDPRWIAQLDELEAEQWWDTGRPHLSQWLDRHAVDRVTALETAIELLAMFRTLPRLASILAPPGTARVSGGRARKQVDERMLGRVRALLAKAESTDFPEEAESLSAKAQELMSRYAIEQTMLDVDADVVMLPGARRIWLDQPYVSAKCLLVAEVSSANRCRSVSSAQLGFVTVVGDELDLDIVELLTTSLMVQATTAMLVSGRRVGAYGQSRTRSFRQSFLISYASRIGERLRASAEETVATAGTDLVPVFAERERIVEGTFETLFPDLRTRSYSIGNADGWVAGRAAADAAVLRAERVALAD